MLSFAVTSLLVCLTARLAAASCAYGTSLQRRQEGAVKIGNFGYSGAISPLNWLSLDPAANIACSTGKTQSPINMVQGQFTLEAATNMQLNIPDIARTEFENLGTTVEVIVPQGAGAGMVVDGIQFNLAQFHFHLPSEHIDNGTSVAMEMHMVFESANAEIAVVGVYVDTANGIAGAAPQVVARHEHNHARDTRAHKRQATVVTPGATSQSNVTPLGAVLAALGMTSSGASSSGSTVTGAAEVGVGAGVTPQATGATQLFDTIFASVGAIRTPGTKVEVENLQMSGLLQSLQAGSFQRYSGSLTTPPCSEGVRWLVSTQKQTISLQSFKAAREVIGFNSRFPQNTLGQDNVISLASSAVAAAAALPAPAAAVPAPAPAAPVAAAPAVAPAIVPAAAAPVPAAPAE